MEKYSITASIIIRAYNAEATIARAIASALAQDFAGPYEIVIVDDGSNDATASIIETFVNKKRVRLVHQENQGITEAANVGIRAARGKVIVLLDADDEALSSMLTAVVQPLLADPSIDYTYPDYYEEYKGSRKLVQTRNPFEAIAGGMAWRKERLLQEGGFAESTVFPEYELLLRSWDRWRGVHVATPVMTYHRRQESLASNEKRVLESIEVLKRKYPSLAGEIEKIRSYAL